MTFQFMSSRRRGTRLVVAGVLLGLTVVGTATLNPTASRAEPSPKAVSRHEELLGKLQALLPELPKGEVADGARVGIEGATPDGLLKALDHGPLPLTETTETASVFDDGDKRLRVHSGVAGAFKFANRGVLKGMHTPPKAKVTGEVIHARARGLLKQLGIPDDEVLEVRPHEISMDVAEVATNRTSQSGTAGYIVHVQRKMLGAPVLGSECQMIFEAERGDLAWLRCRWPTFVKARGAAPRGSFQVLQALAARLDKSLQSGVQARDVSVKAQFVFAEQVKNGVTRYVPAIRAISRAEQEPAQETLEAISGESVEP